MEAFHAHEFMRVRGARENNLKDISLEIPRDALVVFTGVSGSGKSSLAFGTLFAEAQRRYLESVSPYARRLFNQMPVPEVDELYGLPPAIALQQQRGTASSRSSVGSITTISNLLRMLYSRAGKYPKGMAPLSAEAFSPNSPVGACPYCQGIGRVYDATEDSMVPDPSLSIRERAIAAWPSAWHGQNLRDILVTLGFNIDIPWRKIPKKDRDWILYTKDRPSVPVYAGFTSKEVKTAVKEKLEPSYYGNFISAKDYVLETFAGTQSDLMKKRVSKYMVMSQCPKCFGKRLMPEAMRVKLDNKNIVEISSLSLKQLTGIFKTYAQGIAPYLKQLSTHHPEETAAATRLSQEIVARLNILLELGLGHLSLDRSTPGLSPGELQRLRLATQLHSNLFGVVYVLDEPSAGLHPADTEALIKALKKLKDAGNSIFVVEHETEIIKEADWIIDLGPGAGENGGHVIYNGPIEGIRQVSNSQTAKFLFHHQTKNRDYQTPSSFLIFNKMAHNNIKDFDLELPMGIMTCITGISGSGKSSLVKCIADLVTQELGGNVPIFENTMDLMGESKQEVKGSIKKGLEGIKRIVIVDQKPIGRTPRSNLATYTGLFDQVRKIFANTKSAKAKRYDAGHFSFNLPKGRCDNCQGEGSVMVELLFLPSVYAPCPECHSNRYKDEILKIHYQNKNIADVLQLSVAEALTFFQKEPLLIRSLKTLYDVGLGYLRLGQPATELSGGEAQRIKLATELQRISKSDTLYILDEPSTGLHPADVKMLLQHLDRLTKAGNSILLVEHDMEMIAASDWVIELGPGAGDEGGKLINMGNPKDFARKLDSPTAKYLKRFMKSADPKNKSLLLRPPESHPL